MAPCLQRHYVLPQTTKSYHQNEENPVKNSVPNVKRCLLKSVVVHLLQNEFVKKKKNTTFTLFTEKKNSLEDETKCCILKGSSLQPLTPRQSYSIIIK